MKRRKGQKENGDRGRREGSGGEWSCERVKRGEGRGGNGKEEENIVIGKEMVVKEVIGRSVKLMEMNRNM